MRRVIVALIAFAAVASVNAYEIHLDFDEAGNPGAFPAALLKLADAAYEENMKGLALLDSGKADQSIAYFEKALDMVPQYADALNNKAVAYYRRGQIGAAENFWLQVLKLDPAYYTAYYNLGIIAYQSKDYSAAEKLFIKSTGINKQFHEALSMLGKARLVQENTAGAIDALVKAFKLKPDYAGTWNTLAHAYFAQRDTASAIAVLIKVSASADACQMLGLLGAQRKHCGESIDWLTKAWQKKKDPEILYQIAVVQQDSGLFAASLASVNQYLGATKNPTADAYNLAAVAARQGGDLAGVKKYLEQGLAKFPNDPDLRYNLGQVLFFQKDYGAADKLLSNLPDTVQDAGVYYSRAQIARSLGKNDLARKFLEKALKIDQRAEFYDLFGLMLFDAKDPEGALIQFKKALSLNPDLPSARLHVGLIERKGENLDLAITELRKSVASCQEGCGDIALQLATLYYYQNRFDVAAKVLEDLDPESRNTARVIRHLAVFYKAQSRYEKAIDVLVALCKLGKSDPKSDYELALAYLETGAFQQAADLLMQLGNTARRDDARVLYEAAYALSKIGNYTESQKWLDHSLAIDKKNVAAQYLAAYLKGTQGDDAGARALWESLAKTDATNSQLWINMGCSYEKQGDFVQALAAYRKGLDNDPSKKELNVNIGSALISLGKPIDAMDSYRQALASPLRLQAAAGLFNAARLAKASTESDKAFAILKKEFPKDLETRRAGAQVMRDNHDTLGAIAAFESLEPKNEFDWFDLASLYVDQGRFEPAMSALAHVPDVQEWKSHRQALQARIDFASGNFEGAVDKIANASVPDYVTTYNLAVASFNALKVDQAKKSASAILPVAQSDEDRIALLRILGNCAIKEKDWRAGLEHWSALSDLVKDNATDSYNAAVAAYNLGDLEKTWEYYQRARKLKPTLHNADIEARQAAVKDAGGVAKVTTMQAVDSLYNAALEYHSGGKDTVAEGIYRQVLALDDRHYRTWNNLGAIYGSHGELEQAIDCYKNAIGRKADIADGYVNLANIYVVMEEYGEAEKWLKKGFAMAPGDDRLKMMEKKLKEARGH